MELWLELGSVDTSAILDVAVAAEQAGITGLSLSDHLVQPASVESRYPYSHDGSTQWAHDAPWPDAWVTIAAMAAVTTRLRFATGVLVGPIRRPIPLAKSISTAAVLSRDRVVCGLGAGWMKEEFDALGEDFASRGARLDELLTVLRLVWSGKTVEYSGRYYSFGPLRMLPAPSKQLPIWIGGNSDAALRRAVTQDGWVCAYTSMEQAANDASRLRSMLGDRSARGSSFDLSAVGPIRKSNTLQSLASEGFTAAIVPLVALAPRRATQTDDLGRWMAGIDAAATLARSLG